MIQKTFNTTYGKLQISIPGQINEITLGQLIDMQSAENLTDLEAIRIFSGIPLEQLQSIKNFDDLQVFTEQVTRLSMQIKAVYDSDSLPKKITFSIAGKLTTVKVITNLAMEPAGAFLAAREVITTEINSHIEKFGENWKDHFSPSLKACAMLLAHYFYCPASNQWYNEHHAEQFYDEVIKLPFVDTLPIAKYFFLNYPSLSKPKISYWLRTQLLWKKRLALSRFKNSGTLTRSMPLPAAI